VALAARPGAHRSFWGWGLEGAGLDAGQARRLAGRLSEAFGTPLELRPAPRLEDLELPPPRVAPPRSLEGICATDPYQRALHSYGRSFRDVVRAFSGRFDHPPDLVAFPRQEAEVAALLDWASQARVAVVPYGGGSSVVGGVEPAVGPAYRGALSLDLGRMDRVLEVDAVSGAARIQAGVLGPSLEDQLRPHGLTLRHFPQSFEFSSLGGWIATRSAGHFATLHTHIDEMVESLRALAPAGPVETRRLPSSGAGPSPDRLLVGSEGVLGVITEAWVRLHRRPRFRRRAAVEFPTFEAAAEACRALAQSGLHPANCRALDPLEAATTGAGDGSASLVLLAFESADHPVDAWMARGLELCSDHGGRPGEEADGAGGGATEAWRASFLRAPYVRDALVAAGVICETFETAITWERLSDLRRAVSQAVGEALAEAGAASGWVTCRLTHLYPDGPAPYFSVLAPGRRGSELAQWELVKQAASQAVLAAGGTITHHHAVGRDHRPFYDRQRPELFARAFRAAKAELDPAGVLNPGVLIDPAVPRPPR